MTVLHVDMDAFYASVELRSHPELRSTPMIVGGSGRGVVLSANYLARADGVRSGMSSTQARRLCPQAVFVAPNFDSYAAVSRGVFEVFRSITAKVESASIDEAFLDIAGATRMWGPPSQIGERIRALVADEQQITCSVGIGPNKFVAKLASKQAKPDGLIEVTPDRVIEFLHPLPVEQMWGVGEATATRLHQLGLTTVAELAHTSRATLHRAFGPNQASMLADLAWGRDRRAVVATEPERSVGAQQTFAYDVDQLATLRRELLRLSDRVASRLRAAQVLGSTVTISVRFADFRTVTRSGTLASPTDVTGEIHSKAVLLLDKLKLQRARVRRVGVRMEKLVPAARAYRQPRLDEPGLGWRELEQAADRAIHRFGPHAVRRAALTKGRSPESSAEGDDLEADRDQFSDRLFSQHLRHLD